MKNPIILILCVGLLVAASFIYRYEKTSPFSGFPVAGALKKVEKDAPVLLFVFFSRNTCRPCLGFFSLLNQTQDQWPVLGLIPHKEFADAEEIRKLTGAEFPIDSMKKYRRFTPLVNPTIVGVSRRGEVLFIIPGILGNEESLNRFLSESVLKSYWPITNR